MAWPVSSDYAKSLQNPRFAFRLADLQGLTVERNRLGQPRPWSGAFAVVFKGTDPAGRSVALRAFTSEVPERIERYQAISTYLTTRRPQCIVGFQFYPAGVQVKGAWFPLVVMEWVQGETLYDWVKACCERRDSAALARAAELWVALVAELTGANIAHGDLQHANVLVTPAGELKLVDYDCMAVPALFGRRNLEIGVDPYQHPRRGADTVLSPALDRFSALFILVALKALAADPTLWGAHVERASVGIYDKLLIRPEDLDNPDGSDLAKKLRASPVADIRDLFRALLDLRAGDINNVPPLGEVLVSFGPLEEALKNRHWGEAVTIADRMGPARLAKAPPFVASKLPDARVRVTCRQRLEEAAARGDEQSLSRHYQPGLVDDWPAADWPEAQAVIRLAREAARVLPVLQQIDTALRGPDARAAVRLWDDHQAILTGRASTASLQTTLQSWRARNQWCDALLQILRAAEPDGAALCRTWAELERAGGHPDVEPHGAKIQRLVQRHTAWAAWQGVSRAGVAQTDQQLLATWNEPLFGNWPLAERERPRLAEAKRRLEMFARLRPLLQAAPTETVEQQLVAGGRQLPANYASALAERVRSASERLASLRQLRQALADPAPSDLAVADAWDQLAKSSGEALASAAERQRAELAVRRRTCIDALRRIPGSAPINEREQSLLKVYEPQLLADCRDAAPWQEPYREAVARRKLIIQVKSALESGDDLKVTQLLADPSLADYPLPASWQVRIPEAMRRAREVRGLIEALKHNDPVRFQVAFNAASLRRFPAVFAPHQCALDRLIKAMLAPGQVGPRPLHFKRPGVIAVPRVGGYELRWTWPEPRFTDQCRVAVCRNRPTATAHPNDVANLCEMPVSQRDYESGGGRVLLFADPDWDGTHAVVWAEIDVGFKKYTSAPLVLGTLT